MSKDILEISKQHSMAHLTSENYSHISLQQQQQQMLLKEHYYQRYHQQMLALRQRQVIASIPTMGQDNSQIHQIQTGMNPRSSFRPLFQQQQQHIVKNPEINQMMTTFQQRSGQNFNKKRLPGSNVSWLPSGSAPIDMAHQQMIGCSLDSNMTHQQMIGCSIDSNMEFQRSTNSSHASPVVNKIIEPVFPNQEQFDERQFASMMRDIMDAPQQKIATFNNSITQGSFFGDDLSPRNSMLNGSSMITNSTEPTLGSQNSCSSACSSTSSSAGSFPNSSKQRPILVDNTHLVQTTIAQNFENVNSNFSDTNSPQLYNSGGFEQDFKISPIWKSSDGAQIQNQETDNKLSCDTENSIIAPSEC